MTRLPSQCEPEAGRLIPIIDRNRCDGKQDCVAVCPFDVFAMQRLTALDLAMFPVAPRKAHKLIGKWQAFTVRAEACHACNLCVVACPEDAIRLVRRIAEKS
jgi:NAD-dependent dihydropyrimidine dehydrogenase PreA subunit